MLALAVMPVVFVLGETISLGTDFSVTAGGGGQESGDMLE